MQFRTTFAIVFILTSTLFVGCASVKKNESNLTTAESELKLAPTLQYIPVRTINKKTNELEAYIPSQNPYVLLKGKIDKESISQFITAKRSLNANNLKNADKTLTKLTEQDSRLSGPWVIRGDIALKTNKPKSAKAFYEKALAINPKNVNAYIRLAKAERILGNFLSAQNIYTKALALWPDFPEAHLNLGVLYDIYLNHPINAQRHFEAYQFLSGYKSTQVEAWISEIQGRTGLNRALTKAKKKPSIK